MRYDAHTPDSITPVRAVIRRKSSDGKDLPLQNAPLHEARSLGQRPSLALLAIEIGASVGGVRGYGR